MIQNFALLSAFWGYNCLFYLWSKFMHAQYFFHIWMAKYNMKTKALYWVNFFLNAFVSVPQCYGLWEMIKKFST